MNGLFFVEANLLYSPVLPLQLAKFYHRSWRAKRWISKKKHKFTIHKPFLSLSIYYIFNFRLFEQCSSPFNIKDGKWSGMSRIGKEDILQDKMFLSQYCHYGCNILFPMESDSKLLCFQIFGYEDAHSGFISYIDYLTGRVRHVIWATLLWTWLECDESLEGNGRYLRRGDIQLCLPSARQIRYKCRLNRLRKNVCTLYCAMVF